MDNVEFVPDDTDYPIQDPMDDIYLHNFFLHCYTLILGILVTVPLFVTAFLYVFMVVKFKKLRTRPNVVLSQVFVSIFSTNFFYLVCVVDILCQFDGNWEEKTFTFFSIMLVLDLAFSQVSILLMFFLILDWFITVSSWRFKDKYQKNYLWILGIIYVNSIANVTLDFLFDRYFPIYVIHIYLSTPFVLVISSIVAVILYFIYKCKDYSQEIRKTSYRLSVSLTFLLIWSFHLVFTYLVFSYVSIQNTSFSDLVGTMVERFVSFLASLYSVLMFFWLIKCDNHLKACFEHTFRKSVRQYMRNENLDDVERSSSVY